MISPHIEDLKAAYVIVFAIFVFFNISVSAAFGTAKPFPRGGYISMTPSPWTTDYRNGLPE